MSKARREALKLAREEESSGHHTLLDFGDQPPLRSRRAVVATVPEAEVPATALPNDGLLAVRNAHPRDRFVRFDDSKDPVTGERHHDYWVSYNLDDRFFRPDATTSATSLKKPYFEEFNKGLVAYQCSKNRKRPEYFGRKPAEIIAEWDRKNGEASELGTRMHEQIEFYLDHGELPPKPYSPAFQQFLDWAETADLKPFRTEMMVFTDAKTRVSGSVDLVEVVKAEGDTLVLRLRDWKRSKRIERTAFRGRRGKRICAQLPDCNYYHYQLQLNIYRYILETFYGNFPYKGKIYKKVRIESMWICVFHPNQQAAQIIRVANMQSIVREMLAARAAG
jgi:hypothetical protein